MRIRLATAGLLALAVLASVLSVDVADPEPASAHPKTTQDCVWVTSSDYTNLRYRYNPDYVEWVEIEPGYGEYRYGRMEPVWGYRRYQNCGPVIHIPHSHNPWIGVVTCTGVGGVTILVSINPWAGLGIGTVCASAFATYQGTGH